jgi:hypothetical protein
MVRFVKMFGCVAALRLITAANVTAFSAKPQMKPLLAGFQALLASERHGSD